MNEVLGAIITEVGKCLWEPLQRRIGYLVHYKRNIDDLSKQDEYLKAKKRDLEKLIEESERQLEKPTEEVKIWLEKANEIEVAIGRILAGEEGENKKYSLKEYFSKWYSHYNSSKEAINQVVAIKEVLDRGNSITRVSHPQSPPSIIPFASDGIVESKSMRLTLDRVMKALQDESVTAIGVYGMGGVGKTTLMKKLNNKLQTIHLFKKVIMVTVSRNPDLRKIQNEIAERLGLELEHESSTHVRAYKLSMRIKEEGAVLLILDDIWERLELSDVVIPNINESSGHRGHYCKIIITSRFSNVCDQMGAQKKIGMDLLSDEESWILFKEKTGNVVDSPTLKPLAEQVMRECGGLPLAIVAVGLTLRMVDNSSIWSDALRSLKSSDLGELDGGDVPSMISSLKFSYDYLKNDEIKLCFLFCCLFHEDADISLENKLLGYGIGEGFLKVTGGLYEAFDRLVSNIQRLKNCGLLLPGESAEEVQMHDVVRDVAISIARTDEHGFLVKAGLGLEEWPEFENIKQCRRISLMGNDITELPNELDCPNLRTLLLQDNDNIVNIPSDFFNSMSSLLVLDLSFTSIESLPQSLSCLTNLRTLYLNGCRHLRDCSLLVGLKKLLVLSLRGSGIHEVPVAFGELSHLKSLDLSSTKLKLISSGILSKLSQLEYLNIDKTGSEGCGKVALLMEMASLPNLKTLFAFSSYPSFDANDYECLFQDILGDPWPKLNSFFVNVLSKPRMRITLGKEEEYIKERRMTLEISIPKYKFANWVNVLLERTQVLDLVRCRGVRSIEQLETIAGLDCLEWFTLEGCSEMKYLVDYTKSVPPCLFSKLEKLQLLAFPRMREICHGLLPKSGRSFRNLRVLELYLCSKLRTVFSYNLVEQLDNLEELEAYGCIELRGVLPHRKFVDNETTILPKLQHLDLYNCPKLMNIVWDGRTDRDSGVGEIVTLIHPLTPPIFQTLKKMIIRGCVTLTNLFTLSFAQNYLGQLEYLALAENGEMTELMGDEEMVNEEDQLATIRTDVLPRLRVLSLQKLPKVRCVYPRKIHFDLQSLESLRILECPNLLTLPFGPNTAPNLQEFICEKEEWFDKLSWDCEGIASSLRSRIREPDSRENGCTIL